MDHAAKLRAMAAIVAWIGLLACVYGIAEDPQSQWDFRTYYQAVHSLAAGGTPYGPIHPHSALTGEGGFQYPPLTLFLFQWTLLFSLAGAKLIWLGAKLAAVGMLAWIWRRDFERVNAGWLVALFIALGFNAAVLRDLVSGNISTFEQLGLWFAFGLLVRERPYAAATVLACVAQFKLLPIAFLALIPLVRPRDGWKSFVAGGAVFSGLLMLNLEWSATLTHQYLSLFANDNLHMDERGIINPSSLSLFRDVLDLTSYAPGLPYNRVSGTIAYGIYLGMLGLMVSWVWLNRRAALRQAEPRLLVYLGCALFAIGMPRMKDYSYILMLVPALFVFRDLTRREIRTDYLLIGAGLMVFAQPQQTNIPGLTAFIYMLQAYLPLFMAGAVLVYVLGALERAAVASPDAGRRVSVPLGLPIAPPAHGAAARAP